MPIRLLCSALVALAAAASPAAARPVAGDCQMAGPLEGELRLAPVAFVGRVTATDGPVARFAVVEVWAGDVAAEVEVRGLTDRAVGPLGAEQLGEPKPIVSEDDRSWTVGVTYLVLPVVDGGILRDHICTATAEWAPELANLRPADARILAANAAVPGGLDVAIVVMLAALVALGAISILVFRHGDPA